jgi:hypothetical protein
MSSNTGGENCGFASLFSFDGIGFLRDADKNDSRTNNTEEGGLT